MFQDRIVCRRTVRVGHRVRTTSRFRVMKESRQLSSSFLETIRVSRSIFHTRCHASWLSFCHCYPRLAADPKRFFRLLGNCHRAPATYSRRFDKNNRYGHSGLFKWAGERWRPTILTTLCGVVTWVFGDAKFPVRSKFGRFW